MVHSVYHTKAWLTFSRLGLLLLTFMMFLSVNLLYLTLLLTNLDPNWTLSRALQSCAGQDLCLLFIFLMDCNYISDPAWLDPRSTTFTSLMTISGSGVGLAVGLTSPLSLPCL